MASPILDEGSESRDVHPEIESFVERMSKRGVILRYEVRHVSSIGSTDGRVGTIPVEPGMLPEEVCQEIQTSIDNDAEAFTGEQVYAILAYREGEKNYFMRRHIRVAGTNTEAGDGIAPSEPANYQGLLAASHRHNEVTMRIAADALIALRRENRSEVDRLMRRVEHLEDKRDDVAKMWEDARNAQTENELKLVRAKREDRQHELTYRMIDLAAPAMLARIVPNAGLPPRNEDTLRDFLLDISPRQMQRIVSILNPSQVLAIQGLIEAYKANRSPSFGDEIVHRFLDSLDPAQCKALDEVLRPDQSEQLGEIAKAYWEERAKQNKETSNAEQSGKG